MFGANGEFVNMEVYRLLLREAEAQRLAHEARAARGRRSVLSSAWAWVGRRAPALWAGLVGRAQITTTKAKAEAKSGIGFIL